MHIEQDDTTDTEFMFDNLRPIKDCKKSVAYVDALASIVNHTGAVAIPSFKLSVKVTQNGTETLDSDDLSHIHYSVVLLDTNIKNGNLESGIVDNGNCDNPIQFSLTGNENLYFTGDTGIATGTFATVSTTGEWSDLPSATDSYLPRQFDTQEVVPYGVTFIGRPNTTSYQWFRVYVWVDEGYTYTNTGGVVSDPLQNAKIEVTWSANSMMQQVSSEAVEDDTDDDVEEDTIRYGLYTTDGTFVTSWDDLVASGDIVITEGNMIKSVNASLTGELVISDSITIIGSESFYSSSLTGVVIPNSVTSIGSMVFDKTDLTEISYVGTVEEWNAITKSSIWNESEFGSSVLTKVICLDGTITLEINDDSY